MHHHIGETLCVDGELEKRIKAVGFRWVSVNHSNEARLTIYAIKRPLNTVAHKTARRKQAYPVVIEHLCLFDLNTKRPVAPTRCIASAFALIDLIKQTNKETYEQLVERDEFKHHLESMKKVEESLTEEYKKMGIS